MKYEFTNKSAKNNYHHGPKIYIIVIGEPTNLHYSEYWQIITQFVLISSVMIKFEEII